MTIEGALAGSRLPPLEAEVLLAALLRKERTWLLAHGAESLSREEQGQWDAWVRRRRGGPAHRLVPRSLGEGGSSEHGEGEGGEPVAYITGEREFHGRAFHVTPAVLIPRPATERVVEGALRYLEHPQDDCVEADAGIVIFSRVLRPEFRPRVIVDVGTGSGCIAVTLALERPKISVIATDIREDALAIARENAERHGVGRRIRFLRGSHLDPVSDIREPFLLVSNPPYVPAGRILPREVADFEPRDALFAGIDGTDVLRELMAQAWAHPHCAGVIVECQADQVRFVIDG